MKSKIYYLKLIYTHRTPEYVWSDNKLYIRNYCDQILYKGRGRNKIIKDIKYGTTFMTGCNQMFDSANKLRLFRTHDNKNSIIMTDREYLLLQIITTDSDNGLFCRIDNTIDIITKLVDFIKDDMIRNQLDYLPVVVDSGNFDFVKWYKTASCVSPRFWRI